jgi:DNA-binding transcriptional LysR family regulator
VLSPHLPDLAALQVLLAVADTGSLNAAAAELGVSQQAVSARIRSMEAQVGVALLSRTPRGSTLTPQGVIVAEWAARLLEAAREVDAGIAALRAGRRSRLRVSASLTIAEQLLPGWLVALAADAAARGQAAAEVVLTATNSEQVADQVRQGSAELGFVEGPTAPRGLRSRSVGRDELLVVVRPEHPWARRSRPVSVAELARTPLVTREAGSGTRSAFDAALQSALGPQPGSGLAAKRGESSGRAEPALSLSTTAAVRAAVLAGAAPAVLSELAVREDVANGRLRVASITGLSLERTLRAIWLGGATPPAGGARDLLAIAITHGHHRSLYR